MNTKFKLVLAFSILFLFLIQTAGMLVESIYILALLKTSLDEKVLGILFFFSPVLLLLFGKRAPTWFTWLAFALLLIGRGQRAIPGYYPAHAGFRCWRCGSPAPVAHPDYLPEEG